MNYILDIETKPNNKLKNLYLKNIKPPSNYKSAEAIQKWKNKQDIIKQMSVDTDYCEIFCIGLKKEGELPKLLTIKEFNRFLIEAHDLTLITFNGCSFDIPILIKALIKEGKKEKLHTLSQMTNKYKTDYHIDLMYRIAGSNKPKSLDTYLQIYLGIEKKEIDFKTCTDRELKAHCLEDLDNTEKLFNLFNY